MQNDISSPIGIIFFPNERVKPLYSGGAEPEPIKDEMESLINFFFAALFFFIDVLLKREPDCSVLWISMDIMRFYVPARQIDLYVDKLKSLIDIRHGVVRGKRSNKTACAEKSESRIQRRRGGEGRCLLLLLSTGEMRVGDGQWSCIRDAGGARGGRGWFSVHLFDWSTVSYICTWIVPLPAGLRTGGGRLIVKSAPRKTANQSKKQRIDVATRAMSSASRDELL